MHIAYMALEMLNKHRYYINYFSIEIPLLYVLCVLWDLAFDKELILIANILDAIFLSILFAFFDFSKTLDRLKNSPFQVKSIGELSKLNPTITVYAQNIHEVFEILKSSKKFKKTEFILLDPGQFKLIRKKLFRKVSDVYRYKNSEHQEIEISTELSKTNLSTDSRRINDLSNINKIKAA